MDSQSQQILVRLIREERVAAIGTLFHGSPLVSMVLFSASDDGSSFDIHVSRLAQHTQGLAEHRNVGLMIADADRASKNPQTLARLSLQGEARLVAHSSPEYEEAKSRYLAKFPNAAINFGLGDFLLVRIDAQSARLVTGFGKIFDLTPDEIKSALT
jgi:putative heme iron utilization protein